MAVLLDAFNLIWLVLQARALACGGPVHSHGNCEEDESAVHVRRATADGPQRKQRAIPQGARLPLCCETKPPASCARRRELHLSLRLCHVHVPACSKPASARLLHLQFMTCNMVVQSGASGSASDTIISVRCK